MICPDCKKQIPDDSVRCAYCDFEINHQEQLPKEIKQRRWQRWIFYAVFSLLFLSMIGAVVFLYDERNKTIGEITKMQVELNESEEELVQKRQELSDVQEELTKRINELQTNLNNKITELDAKTEEYKNVIEKEREEQEKLDIENANIYNLIIELGVGITNENLNKIPLADSNFDGPDIDGDGLSDIIETALGSNPFMSDSDNDGYSDKQELLGGFDPNSSESLGIDFGFADQQKGNILLQIEGSGEVWYVNPEDGKKYFLGKADIDD